MGTSLLKAIKNIIETPVGRLHAHYVAHNRANGMGEALEHYIKDAFAGTINETNAQKRNEAYGCFSYLGNQNNPPDIIIYGGDAVEVKKIENAGASIALNSSYPKAKLYADSPMITTACRTCEQWTEKDILYSTGVVNDKYLQKLSFVYGVDYAANKEVYERIRSTIRNGVNSIPNVDFDGETKELGRVNRVDPLGITYLRIRGMWGIENPARVFSYIYTPPTNANFELFAIVNNVKYNSFDTVDRLNLENLSKANANLKIINVRIKKPDNPAQTTDAKLITFYT